MIPSLIQKIKTKEEFSAAEKEWMQNAPLSFGIVALYYHVVLSRSRCEKAEEILKHKIPKRYWYENILNSEIAFGYRNLIAKVLQREYITEREFDFITKAIVENTIDRELLAILLVCIYYFNPDIKTTGELTHSILHSGNVHDYRSLDELYDYKVVRRYPTGALSEKIALILPSILSHYSSLFRFCSPFLVAKSLGFTGGTWDKLSTFPDIDFIAQGHDLIMALRNVGTAYCMAGPNVAPADKFLYEFRSLTGTIENESLIVSSIASKQLAIPADVLVMDIRYGEGAFLSDHTKSVEVGESLKQILSDNGMNCVLTYTDTVQPNGVCIGNYWELYEAICILKGIYENDILRREISMQQIELVIRMFLMIVQEIDCIDTDLDALRQEVYQKFDRGIFYGDFLKILRSNHVNESEVDSIFAIKNRMEFQVTHIYSPTSGVLSRIKQKEIGNYVNYYLGNNKYELKRSDFRYSGIILGAAIGEEVKRGDILCSVIHSDTHSIERNYISSLFLVDQYLK